MPQSFAIPGPFTPSERSGSPSFLQHLGSHDLFNNLLFNRERVYQSLRRLPPRRTSVARDEGLLGRQTYGSRNRVIQSIETTEEDTMSVRGSSLVSYLRRADTAVGKPRGRPAKKTPTRAQPKGRSGITVIKKRSLPIPKKAEHASKIRKTIPKSSSGKRVKGRGASVADAFVISDDDAGFDQPRQESRTDSLTPPRQVLKIDSLSSEDDLKAIPTPTPTPTLTHSDILKDELVRVKAAHEKDLAELRQQLNASEIQAKQIKEEAEREAIELQRRQSITSEKHLADLEDHLEAERSRSSDLSWECDHLRRESEAARSSLKGETNLIQQRDEYERLYKEEQDTVANLTRSLSKQAKDSTRKAAESASELQTLAEQIRNLQREAVELRSQIAARHLSSPPLSFPSRSSASSPAPSSLSASLSDTGLRLANIRKTYMTVKKRYDNLHSVAADISTATRSWDCGSFGEFGQYLKQLKTALEENGPDERGVV